MLTLSHRICERLASVRYARKVISALLLAASAVGLTGAPADSIPAHLTGQSEVHGTVVVQAEGRSTALAGVPFTLKCGIQPEQTLSTLSDNDGQFRFTGLEPGACSLEANVEGFSPFSRTITVRPNESSVEGVGLVLAAVAASVDVHAQVSEVTDQTANAKKTFSDVELSALPTAQPRVRDVLPLIPGVVRTKNGTLYIKGEAENQGMLLVDSTQMVDPVTGTFSIEIPESAVQTVSVDEAPFNARYGGFSGGLTTVETKAPPAEWKYALMDFIPGMRGKDGHIVGVSSETPRAFVGGPLLPDKINISESFDYIIRNRPVRGQPWPINETKTRGFNSFTDLQAILSPRHLLSASVAAFSMRTEFADISSLIPQTASSNSGLRGAYVTLNDSYQFSSGTLMTMFRYTRFDSNAYPQGYQDMMMTPEGWRGNFFNSWTRTANQFEGLPTFEFSRKNWHGSHDVTIGADLVHRSYTGNSQSRPTDLIREDGSLAERIAYRGPGVLEAADTEMSEFAQDHWVVTERFAVDTGIRLTSQSNGRTGALSPRLGLAYLLDRSQKTVLRAGVGVFYDRVPLLATTFVDNPARVVSLYDEAGGLVGAPMAYRNVYVEPDGRVRTSGDPGTSARNVTWNVSLDRRLSRNLTSRLSYLHSQTSDVYAVDPLAAGATGEPLLALEHTGNSLYREFQASLTYRAGERSQVNAAYIHSSSRGDLNALSTLYVPFAEPTIRRGANTWLASDIPNRLVGSGIFRLPWRLTVSPVIDVHTGLRYSDVDTLQNYVETPNSRRFPTYFSLDMKIYREFRIPGPSKLNNHSVRLGIYSLNLTNHQNARDVINNISSPYFGHFVGLQHRVTGFVFDFVK